MADGCYELTLNDSYGDGICCTYGEGSFQLVDASGGIIQTIDGKFGTYKTVEFCVTNGQIGGMNESKDQQDLSRSSEKAN